jgi:hypothetical protein
MVCVAMTILIVEAALRAFLQSYASIAVLYRFGKRWRWLAN